MDPALGGYFTALCGWSGQGTFGVALAAKRGPAELAPLLARMRVDMEVVRPA